jgi:hypothetical protein
MRSLALRRAGAGLLTAAALVLGAASPSAASPSNATLHEQPNNTGLQSARASLRQDGDPGEGPFVLQNSNSGKCLDVNMSYNSSPDNHTAPWTPITDWDCNYGDNQQWQVSPDANDWGFNIKNIASQKCLDVFADNLQDGNSVGVFPCKATTAPNQFFTFHEVNQTLGYYEVTNNNSQCIGPPADDNFSNGVGIGIYHCNGNAFDDQRLQWTLYP